MQSVYRIFNEFKRQCHSQKDMIKNQELNNQIKRLQQLKNQSFSSVMPSDVKEIDHFIKVYRLAIRQIERMKMQFTKPSLVKERLAQIFDNQKQQFTLGAVMEKTSQIRSSEIQIPTFTKPNKKQNVIDSVNYEQNFGSPGLRHFFQKKQAQLNNRGTVSNFKAVLKVSQNKSFSKSNSRPVSRDNQSEASRSNASSFMKKNSKQIQMKKILEENRKIKQEYEKKIKREMQLSQFEKALLKDEKNKYILKIQQLQGELENLYRANYRLKEEVEVKQKELKEKTESQDSTSFRNVGQNLHAGSERAHDYYQPYVMKTKHNDLKRLSMKCSTELDPQQIKNKDDHFLNNDKKHSNGQNLKIIVPENKNKSNEQLVVDILGNELERQLKQLQKERSRSNQSHVSSKKWSRQYNPDKYQQKNPQNQEEEFIKALQQDDDEIEKINKVMQLQSSSRLRSQNNADSFDSTHLKNAFQKKQNNSVSPYQPKVNVKQPFQSFIPDSESVTYPPNKDFSRKAQQQSLQYRPAPNYSFTNAVNHDYSLQSNVNNYDTFDMTRTYLNLSQNQQESETNKYIDSRTSTRNKVAFFKDSLILIKNDTFELAYKRSSLVQSKDRVRVIFFVKNKTNQAITVNFKYEYDASYFKLKVNEKLETVPPNGQSRQDLQVYAFSTLDLNQVIDIMVEVNFDKYGLWMPILWIQFQENQNFKMPDRNEEISIIPDRQFKSYQTAKTILPLTFGGINPTSQWAYLYGKSKFGPCYIKLIWEINELKIQTNAKWIDLLAFVMHHVK